MFHPDHYTLPVSAYRESQLGVLICLLKVIAEVKSLLFKDHRLGMCKAFVEECDNVMDDYLERNLKH